MTEIVLKNILRFFVLVGIQVLILNHVQFSGYINPYLYVLFILMLPFNTPNWLVLILGFALGLSVDIFSYTPGLHSAATVFMAFIRPIIIKLSYKKGETDLVLQSPSIKDSGLRWFFTYSLILVTIHHFFLFYLEEFNFHEFFMTFLRIIVSIIATMVLVILSQYIFYIKK